MKNKEEKLKYIPIINKKLNYKKDGENVLIKFKQDKKIQNLFRKIGFKIPKETTIDMDEFSSFVFLQIDGKKTIYEIGENIKEKYPNDSEQLYERLIMFLDFLESQKNWVFYKHKQEKYKK